MNEGPFNQALHDQAARSACAHFVGEALTLATARLTENQHDRFLILEIEKGACERSSQDEADRKDYYDVRLAWRDVARQRVAVMEIQQALPIMGAMVAIEAPAASSVRVTKLENGSR